MGPGRPANECDNEELISEFENACRGGDYEFAPEYREELLRRLEDKEGFETTIFEQDGLIQQLKEENAKLREEREINERLIRGLREQRDKALNGWREANSQKAKLIECLEMFIKAHEQRGAVLTNVCGDAEAITVAYSLLSSLKGESHERQNQD